MIRSLLVRGMLTGIVAGLLVFLAARLIGEPEVERAIAFESTHADPAEHDEPELVSRKIQAGLGLATGTLVYGAAIGGLFSLVFAFAQGRSALTDPRALAARIASLGFLTIVLVPTLKYPANPPSVGSPYTIGLRTAAYFLLIALSLATLTLSVQLSRHFTRRFGPWNGPLLAAAVYLILIVVLYRLLPGFDEVPSNFPASLLWRFRIAAWELQAVLWTTLGLLFGALTHRSQHRT